MRISKALFLIAGVIVFSYLVVAESFQYKGPADDVELEENFADILSEVGEAQLSLLEDLTISTDEGTVSTVQHLRFGGTTLDLQEPVVKYTKSDESEIGSYIFIDSGTSVTSAFFEYELEFGQGLRSKISSGKLPGYGNENLRIFADEYMIIDAEIDTITEEVKLVMSASAIIDYLKEGEKKVYTIDGKKYEIEAISISKMAKETVRLQINGQDIGDLEEAETYQLPDNTIVGIKGIMITSEAAQDVVSLFIGARIIEFSDDYSDDNFEKGFSLNKEELNNAFIQLKGTVSGDEFSLSTMKYRATTSSKIYIAEGERLSTKISDKSLLLGNWDIVYSGMVSVPEEQIILSSSDDNKYQITFENQDGKIYTFPLIHTTNGLGDSTHALFVKEGSSSTDFIVEKLDYFVLSTGTSKNDKSYIIQYNDFNEETKVATFDDLSTTDLKNVNTLTTTVEGAVAEGTLQIGQISAKFIVEDSTDNKLAIDLDGDDSVSGASMDIVTIGGAVIDLGTTNDISFPYQLSITTDASDLDEASTDETSKFEITAGPPVGIDSSSFTGVVMSQGTNQFSGMTNYGAEFVLANTNTANPEELTIRYPLSQRFAEVYIELLQGVSSLTSIEEVQVSTCYDGLLNGDETAIDCGGSCQPCEVQTTEEMTAEEQALAEGAMVGEGPEEKEGIESQCPDGCLYTGNLDEVICMGIGERIEDFYCTPSKSLADQKDRGAQCTHDYECGAGICEESKCGETYGPFSIIFNIILIILSLGMVFLIYKIVR
tara:strand:- start:1809 stop:4121 length:2313 start_codon:yes stop_codon:yes gene_type:complete